MTKINYRMVMSQHRPWVNVALAMGVILLALAAINSCSTPENDNPFGVDFSWKDPIIDGGSKFTAKLNSFNGDVSTLKWSWDFGDGAPISDPYSNTLQNTYHTFSVAGTYWVTLKVEATQANGNKVTSTISKSVVVKYFANTPSATIDSIVPSIFGVMIKGTTDRGEKYEYNDPDPDFFLELSISPDFDTLISFQGTQNYKSYPLTPGAGFRFNFNILNPNTTYYARIRIVRNSLSKANVVTDVSEKITPIKQFNTNPLPEIKITVDTTTNAELIIINASLPGIDVLKENQFFSIIRDNDAVPMSAEEMSKITYAGDSIFYREPNTTLKFIYRFVYIHPTQNVPIEKYGGISIYTPNVLFHFSDTVIRAPQIYNLGKRFTSVNNLREINFFDNIGVSIQWNRSPKDDGTFLIEDEFDSQDYRSVGVFFRQQVTSVDAFSFLKYSVNNITYYHECKDDNGIDIDYGTMVVYKEDDTYIYARMSLPNTGTLYRTGFKMAYVNNSGQQSFRNIKLKGFLFKVKKNFK